jgi:hypothetical protein
MRQSRAQAEIARNATDDPKVFDIAQECDISQRSIRERSEVQRTCPSHRRSVELDPNPEAAVGCDPRPRSRTRPELRSWCLTRATKLERASESTLLLQSSEIRLVRSRDGGVFFGIFRPVAEDAPIGANRTTNANMLSRISQAAARPMVSKVRLSSSRSRT